MIAAAIDAILALVLVEGVGLALLHRRTGRGLALRAAAPTLAAGFFLVLALRLAVGEARPLAILGCLLLSFVAHTVDIAGRWQR